MTPLWPAETEARVRAAAFNMDKQTAPTEVKFCKKCVVSNQRPRIVFDDEGVCSACRYAEHKRSGIDWDARGKEFKELLDRFRSPHGYDVIVPCSGGKDSSMIAHRLKHEYGMTPLCVSWAPFAYTDIGRQNLDAFIQAGFDVQVFTPDGLVHRKLSRLAFEYLGDPWSPFAFGQVCYPLNVSIQTGIRLIMYGENGEAEYGGDPAANDKPCWDFDDWERVYLKGSGVRDLVDEGIKVGAFDNVHDVSPWYGMPNPTFLKQTKPEFHWWSYYHFWHPQENYYCATEHTGFTANPDGHSEGTYSKYASLDDKYDGFHYWMAFIKFGIGRCTSDASHEIRDGEIDRDEAVALVKKFDGSFPGKHFEEFLEYIGCDRERFYEVADRYRPGHLWDNPRLGVWERKRKVWS